MRFGQLIWSLGFMTVGCAQTAEQAGTEVRTTENVRLAQARMIASNPAPVQGTVNFEQMPNSVIVTFRIEGLQPKSTYQLYVQEDGDCNSLDLTSADTLSKLRTSKLGVAENTFKTVDFSVSRERPLLGNTVVIVQTPVDPRNRRPANAICGRIEPLSAKVSAQ